MNDVSWRRILEQVDSGQEFGRDQDTAHALARAHVPKQPSQQNVELSSLEDELARVTRPSAHIGAKSKAQPVRKRQPSPGQHATQLKMRMERAVATEASPPLPKQAATHKPSGARNLIAISLSLAVIGFAAYQLHEIMQQNDADGDISTTQQTNRAASASSDSTEKTQPQIRVSGNRLDLRPSLASQSDLPDKKLAAAQAPDTASSINLADITASLPSTEGGNPDNAVNETLILDRGRNILEHGHVSGARLIFEYLADRGSALGAFALAQTYDAKYISRHNLPAQAADEELAGKWYQQAADLTNAANTESK